MRFTSERGNSFLGAILVAAIVAIAIVVIVQQTSVSSKAAKFPKIKSAMTSVESKVRLAAMNANAYTCAGADFSSCTVQPGFFNALSERIVGCDSTGGPTPPICGAIVQNVALQTAAGGPNPVRTLTATITYTGTDVSMRDVEVSFLVPEETLQASTQSCPAAAPLFQGYNPATGDKICNMPPNCGPNEYVVGVNMQDLAPICRPYTGGNVISCPLNMMISDIQWTSVDAGTGEPRFTAGCTNRLEPNSFFTPAVGPVAPTYGAAIPPLPDIAPANSSVPVSPPPTTTTL